MSTVRLRLIGMAVVAVLPTGCLSAGERQAVMVCDPAVADRCVPILADAAEATGAGTARRTREDGRRPRTTGGVAAARLALATFSGEHFSVAYPDGWRIAAAEAWNGTYHDTTIRNPRSPTTYLRVDVLPGLGEADPAQHARRVAAYLEGQPGYERIAFRRTGHGAFRAVRWDFTVRESGVLLRKVDVFLTDAAGNNVAILTQAPASAYPRQAALFDRLRASLTPRAGSGPS